MGYVAYTDSSVDIIGTLGGPDAVDQSWSDISELEGDQGTYNYFEGTVLTLAGLMNPELAAWLTSLAIGNGAIDSFNNSFTDIKNIMNDQNINTVRVASKVYQPPLMDGGTIEYTYFNVETGEKIYTRIESF